MGKSSEVKWTPGVVEMFEGMSDVQKLKAAAIPTSPLVPSRIEVSILKAPDGFLYIQLRWITTPFEEWQYGAILRLDAAKFGPVVCAGAVNVIVGEVVPGVVRDQVEA